MPKRFDCEDEPNEFMDAPCLCECGKWFDLGDGHSSMKWRDNTVVCGNCHENQEARSDLQEQINDLQTETELTGKGNKRAIAKLNKELAAIGGPLN